MQANPRWLSAGMTLVFLALVGSMVYTAFLHLRLADIEDTLSADIAASEERISTNLSRATNSLAALSIDLTDVKSSFTVGLESISDQLGQRTDELVNQLDTLDTLFSQEITDTAEELRADAQQIRTRVDEVRTELTAADTVLEGRVALQGTEFRGDLEGLSSDAGRLSADLDVLEADTSLLLARAARSLLDAGPLYDSVISSVVEVLSDGKFAGSGFVYGAGADFVITAWHVVENTSTLSVRLFDGTEISVGVAGGQEAQDVAILQLSQSVDVRPLTLADSSQLFVGQPVLVVGSPNALKGSASMGIISALERDAEEFGRGFCGDCTDMVQFDAPSNPGNSGGPLLNTDGEVIGIVSWGFTFGDDSGLNFAVSSNTVKASTVSVVEG